MIRSDLLILYVPPLFACTAVVQPVDTVIMAIGATMPNDERGTPSSGRNPTRSVLSPFPHTMSSTPLWVATYPLYTHLARHATLPRVTLVPELPELSDRPAL